MGILRYISFSIMLIFHLKHKRLLKNYLPVFSSIIVFWEGFSKIFIEEERKYTKKNSNFSYQKMFKNHKNFKKHLKIIFQEMNVQKMKLKIEYEIITKN